MSDPIRLTRLRVESFQRLRFALVELDDESGELVLVTGPSKAGKSSLLRSIRAALGGAGEIVEGSVNDDSPDGTGEILATFSNGFEVRRKFTPKHPKGLLTIEGPDGGRHGQTKLTEWIGPLSFDPLAFLHLHPSEQRDLLFDLANVEGLREKLDEAKERESEAYSERTPWIRRQRKTGETPRPDGERPEPIDVQERAERLDELRRQDREFDEDRRRLEDAVTERKAIVKRRDELDEEIERLRARLERAENERDEVDDELREAIQREGELERMVAELPDLSDEIEEVKGEIRRAREVEERLEAWEAYEADRAARKEADERVKELTEEVEAARQEQRELLASAEIPVDGLDFTDDGEITLHGKPLELAAGGERITMALDVALAVDSDLRICLLDEANNLDLGQVEALARRAEETGVQVFAARMGIEGPGDVVVEDGVAMTRTESEEDGDA